SAPSIFQVRGAEKKRAVEFSMRVIALLASFDNLVETRVLRNPADTNEVRSGVTNRNLSTTETSFINWFFPHAGGIRCPSYAYSALTHVRCLLLPSLAPH